jgi:hypothetical protein
VLSSIERERERERGFNVVTALVLTVLYPEETVQFVENRPRFQRNMSSPFLRLKIKLRKKPDLSRG